MEDDDWWWDDIDVDREAAARAGGDLQMAADAQREDAAKPAETEQELEEHERNDAEKREKTVAATDDCPGPLGMSEEEYQARRAEKFSNYMNEPLIGEVNVQAHLRCRRTACDESDVWTLKRLEIANLDHDSKLLSERPDNLNDLSKDKCLWQGISEGPASKQFCVKRVAEMDEFLAEHSIEYSYSI